jgi:hypothetical protein
MTTTYHTAILTGASATAATINYPLAELDAALGSLSAESRADDMALDDRIDALILGSATSPAEVVDARNGYAVLNDRLDDLQFVSAVRYVDPAFANEAAANRHTTITQALTAASAGDTILIAPGIYTEDLTIGADFVKLIGSGMPAYDSATGRLIGGTIVRGNIDCAARPGIVISDLGVDLYGVNTVDAITAGTTAPIDLYQTFRNLALLGNGYNASSHAILASGGAFCTYDNIRMWYWYHGLAIRGSSNNMTNVYGYACSANTIIIKSASLSGDANYNNVANVVIDGDAADVYARGGPIRLESTDGSFNTRHNTVCNVSARNGGESTVLLSVNGGGSVAYNAITNCSAVGGGDDPIRANYDCSGATDIAFINCYTSGRFYGYGFRARDNAARIVAIGCSSDTSGAGRFSEATGGRFDWLDTAPGGGVQVATFTHLSLTQHVAPFLVTLASEVAGLGTAVTTGAQVIATCTFSGSAGMYTSLAIELLLVSTSGGRSTTYRRTIACSRPGTSSLNAAIATSGTDLASGAGTQGTLAVTVDVATANTLKILVQGVDYNSTFAYTAHVLTDSQTVWSLVNLAI